MKRVFRLTTLILIFFLILALSPLGWMESNYRRSYKRVLPEGINTIVILGAGLRGNQPSMVLRKRLDAGFALWAQGKIRNILVSGSNQDENHNEPAVMRRYLIDLGVSQNDIVMDFGGRRTIDSCWRAKNVFGLSKIALVSQRFHLPRATYLCQNLGLETYPVVADDSSTGVTVYGYFREVGASWEALGNLNTKYEPDIKGNGEEIQLE